MNDRKNEYEDILYLPHHISETHPRMSIADRAAQFSPFQALIGYGDVIRETADLLMPEWSRMKRKTVVHM